MELRFNVQFVFLFMPGEPKACHGLLIVFDLRGWIYLLMSGNYWQIGNFAPDIYRQYYSATILPYAITSFQNFAEQPNLEKNCQITSLIIKKHYSSRFIKP